MSNWYFHYSIFQNYSLLLLSILVIRNIHNFQHVVNDVIVACLLKFFGNSSEIRFYFCAGLMYLEDVIYLLLQNMIFFRNGWICHKHKNYLELIHTFLLCFKKNILITGVPICRLIKFLGASLFLFYATVDLSFISTYNGDQQMYKMTFSNY